MDLSFDRLLMMMTLFRQSCCLWDNVKNNVKPDRPQMTIWRMRVACWIPKSSNTRSEYVNSYCFYSATKVTLKRSSVVFMRTYIASVVIVSPIVTRPNTVDHLHFIEHMTLSRISTCAGLATVSTETGSVYFVSCRSETKHCYTGIYIRYLYCCFALSGHFWCYFNKLPA